MRRTLAMAVSGALVLGLGCSNRYQARMDRTIEALKYERELDKNLEAPPGEGPLKALDVFIRPPKGLQVAKEFQLGAPQSGLFDVERTFYQGDKTFLHVLARKKMPKKAPAKGQPAEPPVARGDFQADVLALLKGVYGDDEAIAADKFKPDPHRSPSPGSSQNEFKRALFTEGGKSVEVYLLKKDPYDVALVYVYDPADKNGMSPKIRYGLESFALGDKAKNKYSGKADAEAEAAATSAPPSAF